MLVDSHLLAAGFYRRLRAHDREGGQLRILSMRSTSSSDRQISDNFLCTDCEQCLEINGERYAQDVCAVDAETFPLLETVKRAPIVFTEPLCEWHAAKTALEGGFERLLYFAASVFWRASAHVWPARKSDVVHSKLAASVESDLRAFLRGEIGFPGSVVIIAMVWTDVPGSTVIAHPRSHFDGSRVVHTFCVPGVKFALLPSENQAADELDLSFSGPPGGRVGLCRFRDDRLNREAMKMVAADRDRKARAVAIETVGR